MIMFTQRPLVDTSMYMCDVSVHFLSFARGAFSIVRKVHHTASGIDYAAKIINTKRLSQRGEFGKWPIV